jgi:hypothetical protein
MVMQPAGKNYYTSNGHRAPDSIYDDRHISVIMNLVNDNERGAYNVIKLVPKGFIVPLAAVNAVKTEKQ